MTTAATAPRVRALGGMVVLVAVNKAPVVEDRFASGLGMNVRLSPGGVAVPDSVDNEEQEFEVVALGDGYVEACEKCEPGGRLHTFEVKVGDRVLLSPWMATTVTVGGVEHWICSERDILGIFER